MKKTLMTALILAPLVASAALSTDQQKGSYALGYRLGHALQQQGQKIDVNNFEQGFSDGVTNKKPVLSGAEQKAALMVFQKNAMKTFEKKFKGEAAKNKQAGKRFLAANKSKPGVKILGNGLQYKVVTAGTGPKPKMGATVTVNYEGKLISGKVFDSSYKRGKPTTFSLKSVIRAWQQAVPMMKQGGTWILYVPAKLAYGPQGVPGMIGPNSTLIFKVNLIKASK